MKPSIKFQKYWSDDDLVKLKVKVCDGESLFTNTVYIGIDGLDVIIKDLKTFKDFIHGGIYDLKLGAFGPEYASGGFQARLHFYESAKGLLYISTYQESAYETFKKSQVASQACMYLKTEPALFDRFIEEIGVLNAGNSEEAKLECVDRGYYA